jgi:hypothetical protein
MKLDNTECKAEAQTIIFAVLQDIVIRIRHHTHITSRNLITDVKKGPVAGKSLTEAMELDLSKNTTKTCPNNI